MDQLLGLAESMAYWRQAHPTPARPESPPTFGAFLKLAALMTWVGGILAVIPLTLLYLKWGGLPTLTIGCVLELAFIGLSARMTWEPRSPSTKPLEDGSERVHLPRGRNRQPSLGDGRNPAAARDGRQLSVAPPESPSMQVHPATSAPRDVLSPALAAPPVSIARQKPDPIEARWAYLLSFAAFGMLALGIWAATQSHAWTPLWPLNVVGGLMSYVPLVLLIAYGNRIPNRGVWPARAVALLLTVAIPFIIWGPVPAPPS